MQPSTVPEVSALQTEMKQQFGVAWQQTIGDAPYFDSLAYIYDGVTDFYDQASREMIVLLSQPDTDQDLYYVFHAVYADFAQMFQPRHYSLAQKVEIPGPGIFMTQKAIDNIVPDSIAEEKTLSGSVSGALTFYQGIEPVNKANSWVTLQDNFTGQIYCLAIYNGEVNKYLGDCKNDYH